MSDDLPDPRALEKFFSGSCQFYAAAETLDRLPPLGLPEVAFAGRSNVGKSTLINALTRRKALARTSHTPGRTQQLNFFNINERFVLVDMPGYGYAKVSKTRRADWEKLIKSYLRGRSTLRVVFLLVDSRHDLKESDVALMKMMDETGAPYRVILTKADKLGKKEAQQICSKIAVKLKKHPAAYPEPILISSHQEQGVLELQAAMLELTGVTLQ